MSLLDLLQSKKKVLKRTETVVTLPDGKVYKEFKNRAPEIVGQTSGFVIDTKPDRTPAKIIDNLFLGSQDCCDLEILKEFSIEAVLSVGIDAPQKFRNVTYKYVECLDLPETNLDDVLELSVPFIDHFLSNNINVLVHCNAGVSRSSSVVIGFLILTKNFSFLKALETCKSARSCVRPNDGFEKQLKLLSK